MMNVKKLQSRPSQFRRLLGLSVEEFNQLLGEVRPLYAAQEAQRLSRGVRQRAVGGGHPFKLALEERLLATLLYYRLHLTGFLLGCLFEVHESNMWRERYHRMLPILLEVLPVPMQDHLLSALEDTPDTTSGSGSSDGSGGSGASRKRIGSLKELLEAYPELRDLCVDGTEQEVPKWQNKREQRQFFSGKSHCHTVKTQVTTAGRLVLHVMGNCPGSMADRQLLKASGVLRSINAAASPPKRKARQGKRPAKSNPNPRRVRMDKGYSGLEKEGKPEKSEYGSLPGVQVLASLKGTGHYKLTALGKAWNYAMVSPQRMQVEQNIGHLKNWRVLSALYRADWQKHQSTVAVVAGLHNFRMLGSLNW